LLSLLFLVSTAGCRLAIPRFDLAEEPAQADDKPPQKPSHDGQQSGPKIIEFPSELASLKQNAWVPVILPSGKPLKPGYRWTHAGMEELSHLPAGNRPDLSLAVQSSDKITVTNAAILQARWGEGNPTEVLAATVRQTSLPLTLRCAAADVLSIVRTPATLKTLRSLTDEFGDLSPEYETRYVPQIHAALLIALSNHVRAISDDRFKSALKSRAADVRLEALRAWNQCVSKAQEPTVVPAELLSLREDDDPRLRALALETLTAYHHPQAQEFVSQALKDYEFSVRSAAIGALGRLADDASLSTLEKLREHPAELTRAAVTRALAAAEAADKVAAAADDKSWLVRKVVAESLAKLAKDESSWARHAQLAEQLLADSSVQVQDAAVAAVLTWPLERSGPVLLSALERGGYKTRKAAAEYLSRVWPAAEAFPLNGDKERRAEILTSLVTKWNEEHPRSELAPATTVAAEAHVRLGPEQLRQLDDLLLALSNPDATAAERNQASGVLRSWGADLLAVLDLRSAETPLPPLVYHEVLPNLHPIFESLDRLNSNQLAERRAAAAAIVQACARAPLAPLALARLQELMRGEHDAIVWQYALQATLSDGREPAVELAYLAIGHESPDVRRRACEYLRIHPAPRHAAVLIPALNDASGEVVVAAVRAMGAASSLEDHQPLAQLLLSHDKHLRLEAATSLARLKDPAGTASLERLSHEVDADIRRRAAVVMGELGDAVFLPSLMPLLRDRPEIQRAALDSLQSITGRDVAKPADGATLSPGERARRWEQWYRDTQAESEK